MSWTDRRAQRAVNSAVEMLDAWDAEANESSESPRAALAWLERLEGLVTRAWPHDPPPLRAAAPLHVLAELCWAGGDLERADVTMGQTIDILKAHASATNAEYLRAVGRRAAWIERMGDPTRADAVLRAAAERLDADPVELPVDRRLARAVLDGQWAELAYERGEFVRARQRCMEGLARLGDPAASGVGFRNAPPSDPEPDPRFAAVALDLWSQVFGASLGLGDDDAAARSVEGAIAAWGSAIGPAGRNIVRTRRVTLALHREDLDGARAAMRQISVQVEGESELDLVDARRRHALALIAQLEGMVAQRRARHHEAVRAFERSVAHRRSRLGRAGVLDPAHDLDTAPIEYALMGVSLAHLGDLREGQAMVGRVLELGRRVPLRRDAALVVLRCYGEVMAVAGELDTARAALTEANDGLRDRFGADDRRTRRVMAMIAAL